MRVRIRSRTKRSNNQQARANNPRLHSRILDAILSSLPLGVQHRPPSQTHSPHLHCGFIVDENRLAD